jgi:hypothetical protein
MVNLLERVYDVLSSFCGDERWKNTPQGNLLAELASALGKPYPYEEEE